MIDPALKFLLPGAFAAALAGTAAYIPLATRAGVVAIPNFRSLHGKATPRGGGIIFAVVCVAAMVWLWRNGSVDDRLARTLTVGGGIAAAAGFADDVFNMRASVKLAIQAILAGWILAGNGYGAIFDVPLVPPVVDVGISWIGLVWFFNLYNFTDGIDGLASCGAVLISALAALALVASRADGSTLVVLGVIVACTLGFIPFNWPPARVFMGDAGSFFLGFCFGTLLTHTTSTGAIDVLVWMIVLAFFAGDTTTTTVLRIFLTDKWYGEHRSHAYQNLARLHGHRPVVYGVLLFHLLWILPLTIAAQRWPALRIVLLLLAVVPVVAWTFRYGPRLSSA